MKVTVRMGKLLGFAELGASIVTIDPRQSQKEMLDTAVHEGVHVAFPTLSEEEVERAALIIAQVPWKLGFRRKIAKKTKTKKKNHKTGKSQSGSKSGLN
jgi:hypothetical protein